jgi:hypothetical protein
MGRYFSLGWRVRDLPPSVMKHARQNLKALDYDEEIEADQKMEQALQDIAKAIDSD